MLLDGATPWVLHTELNIHLATPKNPRYTPGCTQILHSEKIIFIIIKPQFFLLFLK